VIAYYSAFPKPGLRLTATRSGQSGPVCWCSWGEARGNDEAEALKLLARLCNTGCSR